MTHTAEIDAGWRWPCDNYVPPLTCLTAPSTETDRCEQCQATLDGLPHRCPTPGCPGDGRYAAPGRGHRVDCTYPYSVIPPEVDAS